MRIRCATLAIVIAAAVMIGCGDDESPAPATSTSTTTMAEADGGEDPSASPACRAVSKRPIEGEVAAAGRPARPLERSANDSLDLSICEYRERRGPDLYVSVTLDTAPKTALRYYNLIAEALQRATFEHIPDSTKPVGVRGVGNDRTHGGVGAYWTPYRSQLTAIDERTLVKVNFNVPGADPRTSRAAATEIARQALDSIRR